MTDKNIIISIFNESFKSNPEIISGANHFLEKKIKELKIDIQDLSLIETISTEDLNEIVTKIQNNNESIVNKIINSGANSNELYEELTENFLKEITNTIDFVYNLIISKQLGG